MGVRFDRVVDRHPGQRCSQPGEAVPGPSQIEPQIRGGGGAAVTVQGTLPRAGAFTPCQATSAAILLTASPSNTRPASAVALTPCMLMPVPPGHRQLPTQRGPPLLVKRGPASAP